MVHDGNAPPPRHRSSCPCAPSPANGCFPAQQLSSAHAPAPSTGHLGMDAAAVWKSTVLLRLPVPRADWAARLGSGNGGGAGLYHGARHRLHRRPHEGEYTCQKHHSVCNLDYHQPAPPLWETIDQAICGGPYSELVAVFIDGRVKARYTCTASSTAKKSVCVQHCPEALAPGGRRLRRLTLSDATNAVKRRRHDCWPAAIPCAGL